MLTRIQSDLEKCGLDPKTAKWLAQGGLGIGILATVIFIGVTLAARGDEARFRQSAHNQPATSAANNSGK